MSAQSEVTFIRSKTELMVRFDRIVALVLECISANFIQQANVTAFLSVIEQYTTAFFRIWESAASN
jgi:hypothetical protein